MTHAELPLICSFYTQDWEYPRYAEQMVASCERLGLRHRIEELPSKKNWLGNCCMKPLFIRDCLEREAGHILWIDVDGSLYQRPTWCADIAGEIDFAARRKPDNDPTGRPFHVSTLYFAYTEPAMAFIDRWIAMTGDCSDESSLNELWLAGGGEGLRWVNLPRPYFEVASKGWQPSPSTVIAHRWSTGDSKRRQMAELRKKRGF